MTKRWLKRARITADPAGDLIAIMRRHADDADLPPRFRHIGAMRAYLRSKGASYEALTAVTVSADTRDGSTSIRLMSNQGRSTMRDRP